MCDPLQLNQSHYQVRTSTLADTQIMPNVVSIRTLDSLKQLLPRGEGHASLLSQTDSLQSVTKGLQKVDFTPKNKMMLASWKRPMSSLHPRS